MKKKNNYGQLCYTTIMLTKKKKKNYLELTLA